MQLIRLFCLQIAVLLLFAAASDGLAREPKPGAACSPAQLRKKPKMILGAESENSSLAELDAIRLREEARVGNLQLAVDGKLFDEKQLPKKAEAKQEAIGTLGIESPNSYGAMLVVRYYARTFLKPKAAPTAASAASKDAGKGPTNPAPGPLTFEDLTDFAREMKQVPSLHAAWEELKKAGKKRSKPSVEAMAHFFDESLKDPTQRPKTKLKSVDQAACRALLADLGTTYFKRVRSSMARSKSKLPPQVETQIASISKSYASLKPITKKAMAAVSIEWRNQELATNIIQTYCRASQLNKPIHIQVSKANLPGLKKRIQTWSHGKVRLEQKDTEKEFALQLTEPGPSVAAGRAPASLTKTKH